MAKRAKDPTKTAVDRLDAILEVLRDLTILTAKGLGLSRDQVRDLLGVDTHRVSRVWKYLRKSGKD